MDWRRQNLAQLIKYDAEHPNDRRFKTISSIVEAAGFAKTNANANGWKIIKDEGVRKELIRIGFNPEAANAAVAEILISGKEENRLKAAQEIYKVHGSYAPEQVLHKGVFYHLLEEIQNNGEDLVTRKRENNSSDNTGSGGAGQNSREQIVRSLEVKEVENKQSILDN